MAAYLVMATAMQDDAAQRRYRDAVMPLIAQIGGRHARGRGGVERLEGSDDGRRTALLEFASMADIRAFWSSPEYGLIKELRRGAATLEAWAVPGTSTAVTNVGQASAGL